MSSKDTTPGQAAYLAFGGGCAWVRLSPIQQAAWDRVAAAAAKIACAAEIAEREKCAARAAALEAEIDEANSTVASLSATLDALETALAAERVTGLQLAERVAVQEQQIVTARLALTDAATTVTNQGHDPRHQETV
jgi:predicted  nucleic acid-binding Zn-ribbon protein